MGLLQVFEGIEESIRAKEHVMRSHSILEIFFMKKLPHLVRCGFLYLQI
ncbi:MAG: hypothetical protein HC840_29555 [Leptolyngbyaceae cyanobacterium RM2_2_4]|nr:hypothetical protein [Leptolyngbyaceae cyanobacterium RM2_2_4]